MNYEEKKQARIERYDALAQNAEKESVSTLERARSMAHAIPFGQPILVGHHSEGRDRRFRNKIHNTFGKGFEQQKKAESYAQKAKSAKENTAISSDDPNAVTKLKAKIESAQGNQKAMKDINRIIKSKKLPQEEKIEKIYAEHKISKSSAADLLKPDFAGRIGFPSYSLSNNNSNIGRMKLRLAELEKQQGRETSEETHGDVTLVRNAEENRIQFIFPGKPESDTRQILKSNGFRWAPSQGAWQRQLNIAGEHAARRVLASLKEEKQKETT